MEHQIKFPRLEELAKRSGGPVADSDYTFKLLQLVDVRDAMSTAIAGINDIFWHHVRDHMNQDAIWRYWMQRDLQLVFDHGQGNLPKWIDRKYISKAPKWKVYYLWMRLIMGFLQWNLFRRKMDFIVQAYPRKSTLKYVTLNTFQLNNDQLLDFRTEFNKMGAILLHPRHQTTFGTQYSLRSLLLVSRIDISHMRMNAEENDVVAFLEYRYKMDAFKQAFHVYSDIFDVLINWLTFDSGVARFGSALDKETLQNPPRAIEYTRILLGGRIQCDGCGSHVPEMRCKHCETYFCDAKCAIKHQVH